MGVEPRLAGAISAASVGALSAPVEGSRGAYIFVVDSVVESAEPQSAEAEKVRLEATSAQQTQQRLFGALEGMAKIEDLRGATL